MDITVRRADSAEHETPLLAIGIFEDSESLTAPARAVDEALAGHLSAILAKGVFKGREGNSMVIYPGEASRLPADRLLLVGVGKRETVDAERLRRAAATAVTKAGQLGVDRISTTLHHVVDGSERIDAAGAARAVAEGLELGSYRFDEYKSTNDAENRPTRVVAGEILEKMESKAAELAVSVRLGAVLARAQNLARTLGNLPGNTATPDYLARRATEIADRHGMKATILGPKELVEEKLHALLAVARGSEEEPRLIVLEHRRGAVGGKPLLLVGKGLTFDSGGISIKPSGGMEEMKFDMCGGAAVLAAMQAIGELELPVDVVAIVPASENMISGRALKPGDIIQTHKGTTVEVVNTDAEGRLILADALSFARRFDPAAIIDSATLTGACVMALGHQATGGMTNDEALLKEVRDAGDRVGERVWPLPMYDEYRDQIKSDYADIKNSGGRPAGTITAAWFLREFVGDTPWVHLDIAGTAYGDGKLPYQTKGATGTPTRLLVEWVLSRAA